MKTAGTGGGRTITGLNFENRVDFLTSLKNIPHYQRVKSQRRIGDDIRYRGKLVARCFKKHDFYRFLSDHEIDWQDKISQQLLPDDALLAAVALRVFPYREGDFTIPVAEMPASQHRSLIFDV